MDAGEGGGWLVICFSVPAEPSALRVATWRSLKQVGAVALGTGVYMLPDREGPREVLVQVSERINKGGGTAFVLRARGMTERDERVVMERASGSRAEDYAQVTKSANRFVEHVGRETATRDFRFAEVESLEEEMEKVRRQLRRVLDRDYFESMAKEDAQAAVIAAERALAEYVELASTEGEP
jgi:hypothetical protein